jgi:hypothetical protein
MEYFTGYIRVNTNRIDSMGRIDNIGRGLEALYRNFARAGFPVTLLQLFQPSALLVLGWADTSERFNELVLESGLVSSRDDLLVSRVTILPTPTIPVINCAMPNNSHRVSGTPKHCSSGHAYCDNHRITNCVCCGLVLR